MSKNPNDFDQAVQAYEAQHYDKAYALFEKIGKQDPNAYVNMALMHLKGNGCQKDEAKAVQLLEQAALAGNMYGAYQLGVHYQKAQDTQTARDYFEQAAKKGHAQAQCSAGLMYMQDNKFAQAMQYLITAAHNNNAQAQSVVTYVSDSEHATSRNEMFYTLDEEKQKNIVSKIINDEIAPMLAADGGGIELVNYIASEKPQIWLRYLGACSGCQLGTTSTADMLLKSFQKHIDKNVVLYLM